MFKGLRDYSVSLSFLMKFEGFNFAFGEEIKLDDYFKVS